MSDLITKQLWDKIQAQGALSPEVSPFSPNSESASHGESSAKSPKNEIEWDPQQSSDMAKARYGNGALTLQFRKGSRVYRYYPNVPIEVWNGLRAAESPGKFFYAAIRGKFQFERVI